MAALTLQPARRILSLVIQELRGKDELRFRAPLPPAGPNSFGVSLFAGVGIPRLETSAEGYVAAVASRVGGGGLDPSDGSCRPKLG